MATDGSHSRSAALAHGPGQSVFGVDRGAEVGADRGEEQDGQRRPQSDQQPAHLDILAYLDRRGPLDAADPQVARYRYVTNSR